MAKNETKSPVISQGTTTAEGLKVNTVLLADNLLPSKFEDSKFVPRQANELLKEYAKYSLERKAGEKPKEMIAALGSTETIYSPTDCGLFAAVLTAYNNHWKLRTSPDDWWFCVIKRVASAIDKNAKKESVRKMFVDHEEKKTIEVEVPDSTIYTVDYSWFFDQIAKGIQENVKVPEFVDGMTADFSTTTAVQKIVFADYIDVFSSRVFQLYDDDDVWNSCSGDWWDLVEKVFSELLDTYQGKPDREWWSHIMSYERAFMSGQSGGFRGWMTEFLEGTKRAIETRDMTTGLVSVPLVIKDPSGVQDTATLVAGMLGFTIHTDDTKEVSVQPFQGWSLVLSKDSPCVI
ncbi:hypothetical protein OS493_007280 [Desmophyllum pertusum]|uniref:Uncharacterized protein n=1 Tax=Desmophyllum pertusum TaxID=174260 RepID=A0A9W9Z311_9CNID|nr:hypothetical protein OS493_007280 [Desmophyllum pertusum]